jgi:predicted  nucleic acid-binding Zn-ribbon protein
MAKTKNKKEDIIDLKPEKITNEQLVSVQTTVNSLNRLQLEIGMFETKKHRILHEIASLNDELTRMQSEFEKEYGTFDIDIKDGKINYPKENGEVNKKD